MRNIIIDCDPGHDDAIAICLALAHKKELNINAITTVAGNQTLDKVTTNALKIIELLGEDIDVAKGAISPLIRELKTAPVDAHGSTGMDGPILPKPIKTVCSSNAVEYMLNVLRRSKEKITIVAIGPLTNIALLIKTYPEIIGKIEEISLMGGGLFVGNATSAAEFNIYVDPEAAKIVFESGVPITMSGLDVTNKAYILKDEFEGLRGKGKISHFIVELLDFYYQYSEIYGYIGSGIHDACAIAYLLKPELFDYKYYHVDVMISNDEARGMTLADTRPKPVKANNIKVLLDVDRQGFLQLLFDAFEVLDTNFE